MAVSPEDAGECQVCEAAEATGTVLVSLAGTPVGPLFVCEDCAEGGVA